MSSINLKISSATDDATQSLNIMVAVSLLTAFRNGITVREFEEENGCTLSHDGISFHNDSDKTLFMLKYKT